MRPLTQLVICLTSINALSQSIPSKVLSDWDNMTKDGGTWITEDNTGEYDAWGMQFSWGLGKKSVNATLYAIKNNQNIGTIWNFKVYYHPVEKEIILEQWGSDGSYGRGDIQLFPDGNSENVTSFYNMDGTIFKLKHIQRIEGDIKFSNTFTINEDGAWQENQSYVWKRVKG